jgi:PAS domain S-box-containing protein
MDKPLNVLHLEDNPDFPALVSALLEKENLAAKVVLVTDLPDFVAALEKDSYDIILADYMLPSGTGMHALQAVQQRCPEVPFLLLSGAIGEHAAIDFLRKGATDYILKSNLERLTPAIRRAMQEVRERGHRKQAEADVREGEKQYQLIFNSNPVPMCISDLKTGVILEVNDAAVRHYGYSRDEFLRLAIQDVCSREEAMRLSQFLADVVSNKSETAVGQAGLWQHRKKDGSTLDMDITWSVIKFKGLEALLTIANDVTELGRATDALKRNEASLAAAQRIAHLGSWEMDVVNVENFSLNPLRWSDETCRIFGMDPHKTAVTPEMFLNSIHPADRKRIKDIINYAFLNRKPYDVEHRIVRPGGGERIVRARAEFVLDSSGRPVQMRGIILDITERKYFEELLRQSQKMEAIGHLAGDMAHDFNNILTVTHGHALLLMGEKNLSKSAKESVQQIAEAAERAAGLTQSLLAFSRRQIMQPERLDLNEVLNGMSMTLMRILGEDIKLQLKYWPQPVYVTADASMIGQVIMNLAMNARDAMPKGGALAIEVALADVSAAHAAGRPDARPGRLACQIVADSGSGIAPENLRRIFEPFFTTREGERVGLGLATVYGIVKQHQGWIDAQSVPGKGSTFRVYFPINEQKEGVTARKPGKGTVRGGTETILVVEDEAQVRDLVRKLLTGYGYDVISAESGAKALDLMKTSKKKIDLLLTDMVMPDGVNGRELAEKLKKGRPKLKVIFTSGYSADVWGKDFELQRGQQFVRKPYDLHKLAQTVRTMLDTA